MDAAKGMWLFYENPDANFGDLRLKFADIRKRAFRFPHLGKKATFCGDSDHFGDGVGSDGLCRYYRQNQGYQIPLGGLRINTRYRYSRSGAGSDGSEIGDG